MSLSARRAWIEITYVTRLPRVQVSLSARRAWIEIIDYVIDYATDAVALRKESVDRNSIASASSRASTTSLSARRAWIEITYVTRLPRVQVVALRKESVDRNNRRPRTIHNAKMSLSARRAWIEIKSLLTSVVSSAGRSPQGERG